MDLKSNNDYTFEVPTLNVILMVFPVWKSTTQRHEQALPWWCSARPVQQPCSPLDCFRGFSRWTTCSAGLRSGDWYGQPATLPAALPKNWEIIPTLFTYYRCEHPLALWPQLSVTISFPIQWAGLQAQQCKTHQSPNTFCLDCSFPPTVQHSHLPMILYETELF